MAANWKIQNGPFGTLYGPQRIQKKCSEQLGSRSIRWRGQMVHRAKIKIGKRSPGQKWTKNWCKGFARKACFLMVWGRVWPLGARFLLSKYFFCQNFDRFWCSRVVAKFWFSVFDFFDFVIFPKFLVFINFAPKVAATLSGSNKNLLSGAIKYSNRYYSIFFLFLCTVFRQDQLA